MANEKNLEKGKATQFQTGEKQARIASKAGKASGKARREKKTIQNLLTDLFDNPCKDNPQFEKLAVELGLDSKESIKKLFVIVCSLNTLKQGKIDDLKTLMELMGESVNKEEKVTPFIEQLAESLFKDE